MDQHRIRCVLATGETGSITRAANLLYSSPQHVKDEVDAAERELGCPLFVRSHKGCAPTEAGVIFLEKGPTALKYLETFCDEVTATAQGRQEVRVQSFEGKEIPVLDDICLRFRQAYPEFDVRFVNATAATMLDDIVNGTCDVAFFSDGTPFDHSERLRSRRCEGLTMGYQVIASRDDPIAGFPSVAPEQLAERVVAFCGASAPAEFEALPISSTIPWERYAILNHCAAGGLCIVDEYVDVRSPSVVAIPFDGLTVQICCLFRPNPPEPVRRFLEMTDVA